MSVLHPVGVSAGPTHKMLIATLLLTFILAAPSWPAAPPGMLRSGDAYAMRLGNDCSWRMGTAAIEMTVAHSKDRFALVSLKSKLAHPAKQFVLSGNISPEVRLVWDGQVVGGNTSGWTCAAGNAVAVQVGGATTLQVTIMLRRAALEVTRTYLVFPFESLIREWSSFTNRDSTAHELRDPSMLEARLLSHEVRQGHVRLLNMGGAYCCGTQADGSKDIGPFTLRETRLAPHYFRVFDSYDEPGCVSPGSTAPACKLTAWQESATSYLPWFALKDTTSKSGVAMGFDYFGHWQVLISGASADLGIRLRIANFAQLLAPGGSVTMPPTFVMMFQGDMDDMGNRLVDWQYRYLWEYARPGYFAGVAAPGNWCAGTQWCGNWDPQGIRQKIFSVANRYREIGFDVHWTDNGWWKAAGDWTDGPDFHETVDYLDKSGIKSILYYPIYGANKNSDLYRQHADWFQESIKGYTDFEGDLSIPAFEAWMAKTLLDGAQRWGNYEFRADAWPLTRGSARVQLAEDQAYRRVLSRFLDGRPGSAFYAVNSGGNELGYDYVRYASHVQYSDTPNARWAANAAFLFPVDKLNPDPNAYSMIGYCSHFIWESLANNPAFYSSEQADGNGRGDTTDPAQIECARRLVDMYHYMVFSGVAGRWVRQFHPLDSRRSDSNGLYDWFQRVSADGNRAMLHRVGGSAVGALTVFPRGLNPSADYDLSFQFQARKERRSGADLMARGIDLPAGVEHGDIVYFNMNRRPGSGTDHSLPSPPPSVSAQAATHVNYPGVDVVWQAATDDNWVSFYRIYRDGALIGRVSKGLYYFDYGPGASARSTYSVQTVDGDGNASAMISGSPGAGFDTRVVDDRDFEHDGFVPLDDAGSFQGTLSVSRYPSHAMSRDFVGAAVELYVRMGPDGGCAKVDLDGRAAGRINTYAPDTGTTQVAIFSKAWPTVGNHRIVVSPTYSCDKNATTPAESRNVYIDGLRLTVAAPTVTPSGNTRVHYQGSWDAGAPDADVPAGGTAEFSFDGGAVRIIGNLCSACGQAEVYIDGTSQGHIDLYGNRGNPAADAIVFERGFAARGPHVIRLVARGIKNIGSSGFHLPITAFYVN